MMAGMQAMRERRLARISSATLLAVAVAGTGWADQTVTLAPIATGDFRWRDAAGNLYAAAYRQTYAYSQGSAAVTFRTNGTLLVGTLQATNLKPNFTYQFKLEAQLTGGWPSFSPERRTTSRRQTAAMPTMTANQRATSILREPIPTMPPPVSALSMRRGATAGSNCAGWLPAAIPDWGLFSSSARPVPTALPRGRFTPSPPTQQGPISGFRPSRLPARPVNSTV